MVIRVTLMIGIFGLGMGCVMDQASAQETAIYKSVLATDGKWEKSGKLYKSYDEVGDSPDFLIENGELFLKIQDTHTKWWLYVVVNKPKWPPEKLAAFKQDQPEIVELFPDPHSPTGGIAWLNPR
jgi:hypothetical protein